MATVTKYQTAPQRSVNQTFIQETAPQKKGVRGGPVIFWLVAGIAVGADLVDIFTSMLNLLGLGLQVIPVIGNAAGIAIAALAMGTNVIVGLFINFIMLTYFSYIGGSLGRRLVVISIGAIMEVIPVLEILPLTTAMFFLSYFIGKMSIMRTVTSLAPIGKKILGT
jgi:hypothetical protein